MAHTRAHFRKDIALRCGRNDDMSQTKALWEAALQMRARTTYHYIPAVYSVTDSVIHMKRVIGHSINSYIELKGYAHIESLVDRCLHAIRSIHKSGVIHGDIYWGNIMVQVADNDEICKVWIIDFGEASVSRNPHRRSCEEREVIELVVNQFHTLMAQIALIDANDTITNWWRANRDRYPATVHTMVEQLVTKYQIA